MLTRVASPRAMNQTAPLGPTGVVVPHSYPMLDGPPVTQPSSISVSTGSFSGPPMESGRKTAAAAIIGLLLGAGVLASALVYRQSTRRTPAASDTTLGDPTAVAQPTTATPPPIPLPSPAATDEPEPAPKATAATPTTTAAPVVKSPRTTPKPAPPPTADKPTASPSNDDCSTPYWYDSSGVKHYKAHCLNR